MTAFVLELKHSPEQRLDLSPLTPESLSGLAPKEIETLNLATTRKPATVGDLFKIKSGYLSKMRFIGTDHRCDRIGHGLSAGEITVEGDAGAYLGAAMSGGKLTLTGSAGMGAGASMSGGALQIDGNVEERAAGMFVGQPHGMQGGRLVIGGKAGPMLGERMRRGLVVVGGDVADYAGARVIAGTIILKRGAGRFAGYGMRRGSLILLEEPKELLPTFGDCGVLDFDYLRVLEHGLRQTGVAINLGGRARRFMGDMAVLGKGEMLVLA